MPKFVLSHLSGAKIISVVPEIIFISGKCSWIWPVLYEKKLSFARFFSPAPEIPLVAAISMAVVDSFPINGPRPNKTLVA